MKLSLSKKMIGGMVALGILTASMVAAIPVAAAGNTLTINAPTSVANGANFNVTIAVDAGQAIAGAQATVNFDNTKVAYVAQGNATVYAGNFFGADQFNTSPNVTATSVKVTSTTGGPTTVGPKTGTWITLQFHAIAADTANAFSLSTGVSFVADSAPSAQPTSLVGATTIIGTPPTPDLTVSAVTANGTTADYTVSFKVSNLGNLAAPATTATVVVDGTTTYNVAVGAIAAGAFVNVTSGTITITGQIDNFVVTADAPNAVLESNEANNTGSGSYSFVPPPAGQTTDVNGTITGTLSFTQPSAINFGAMSLGNNHQAGTLNVKTNDDWQVTAATDIASGKMTKWSIAGSAYTASVTLHTALKVSTTGGYLTAQPGQQNPANAVVTLSGTPALMANGVTDGQVTSADGLSTLGEDRVLNYDQLLIASDAALANGFTYHIVVAFVASNIIN